MAIEIQVYDGLTPVLQFIADRNFGLARECLSITGSKIRKQAEDDMKTYSHTWHQKISKNGNRVIFQKSSQRRILGTTTNHKPNSKPIVDNIGKMITSFLPKETSMYALSVTIGGANKGFQPIHYEKGLRTNKKLDYVNARSSETRAIFDKLNTGKLNPQHPYSRKSIFEKPKFKARPFLTKAGANAEAEISKSLNERYAQVVPKLVNNANLKIRKVG